MKKLIKTKNDRLSLQQAFHNFLTLKKSEGRTKSTLNSYSTQLSCFFSYCTDKKISFVDQITKNLVDEYRVHLLNRADITQDTRASYVRALKSFVSYLVSAEELDDFKIPNFPIASKTSVSTYSDEEIKQLLSCPWSKSKDFSEQRDYVMMLTLFLTGARRSTVRAMRIDDVNFEDELLTLRHIKRDMTFQIRQVPLNSDLKTAISKYLRKTGLCGQSEYLFPNVEGGLLHVDEEIQELNGCESIKFPKYTSQLINWANQNAQGTRPKVVGQLSDLFPEYQEQTERISLDSWAAWYYSKHPDAIDKAAMRIYEQVENLKSAIGLIDYDMVKAWVRDLVIDKTYNGLYVQQVILSTLAKRLNKNWRLAVPAEESVGIDGFVDDTPYSIKPDSYKTMERLSERIEVKMIFYTKTKTGLTIEVED